jgi:hypothetical protein
MVAMDWPKLPLTGRCPCEAVQYEVAAMPRFVYACHCTECQRWSGSAFSLSMPVASDAFRITRGEPRSWKRVGASGIRSTYWFCGHCGGRVYGEREGRPETVVVRAGTLDQTWWLRPIAHVYLRSAQANNAFRTTWGALTRCREISRLSPRNGARSINPNEGQTLRLKDRRPCGGPALKVAVRLGGVLERIGVMDRHFQAAADDSREHRIGRRQKVATLGDVVVE